MAGKRDTDSDMGQSSRPTKLSLAEVANVLNRLERTKTDKTWIKGKIELISQAHEYLGKKVEEMESQVSTLTDSGTITGNRASEARRIAKEAKEAASLDHVCLHKETMDGISRDVVAATKKVDEWDELFRKALTRGTRTIVGSTIVFAGVLVGWLVILNLLADDVEAHELDIQAGKTENAAQAEDIEDLKKQVKGKPSQNIQPIVEAITKALDLREREAAKNKVKPKPRRSRRPQ